MERILHILPRTPVGGVGAFLMNTVNTISKNYVFDYLIIEDVNNSKFIPFVENKGSKVYLLNEKLSLLNFKNIKNKIKTILESEKYSIVHLHSANIASLVFPICKKCNISIRILHSHSTKYSDNLLKSIRNYFLELPMFKYSTNLIACSDVAGKFLFKNRKYEIIYNGIDCKKFCYKQKKKNTNKYIIGHVGNFVPAKNHDFLLKVFNRLNSVNDNYELWLFGDGKTREKIESKVDELNLKNKIKFFGRVSNIQDFYTDIDLLLLPSFYEGFPVAAMEAQSCGLPIIASTNVTDEINFYGDDIFLKIDDNSIDLWVDAILNIDINKKKDKAKKFKESKFTINETTKKLEKYYDKCIMEVKK